MADLEIESSNEDDDLTSLLSAEFDKAEAPPEVHTPEREETPAQRDERERDEQGRFAKKAEEPVAKETVKAPVKTEQLAVEVKPAIETPTEAVKPPPGFSPTAKAVWDKEALSKDEWGAVKRDIAKRNEEVGKGFEKLAEFKPIERFNELAKQSGTTLEAALTAYTTIERQLTQDFQGGILQLCQRNGVNPVQLANSILSRHGGQSPQPDGGGTNNQARQPAQVDLSPVMQKISALENFIQQQQSQGVQSEIQKFASNPKNVFFENVKTDMGHLITSGQAESLDDAYDKACWANKEIRDLLIKQQMTAAPDLSAKANAATQARAAARSITGSPIPNAASKGPETSIEDEIRQAFDAALV